MKLTLFLLALVTGSTINAQTREKGQDSHGYHHLRIQDSLNNALTGKEFVRFSAVTLDGRKLDNKSIRGKVAFFTFWYKGCAPCLREFDELNELYSYFSNDTNVVFVAITFDRKEDITDVLAEYNVTFPVAMVPSQKEIYRMNYGNGFPSAVLLDRNGNIRRAGHTTIVDNEDMMSTTTLTVDSAKSLIGYYKTY